MPTYMYRCKECRKTFERVLTISEHDRTRPACPKCKSRKVEQCITGFHAVTKKKS